MSKLDSCHWQFVHALEKDGWTVNPKPAQLIDEISGMMVRADLYAERDENERVIVEVKRYPQHNKTQELYISFGQYVLYRTFLENESITTPLYLAIPKAIYDENFHHIIRKAVQDNGIKLVVIDIEAETIEEWIE
jgi:hypothetical protein